MMRSFLQRAALVFGAVVGVFAPPAAVRAQKALVYCPVSVDATGCNAIVTALTGPAYPLGVDRGYDGTGGTVDLEMVDLFAYSVFVVPSLADGAASQPYAKLRDPEVVEHLKAALIGRIAMWSGSPDQGATNRGMKDALIQNLAGWAGGAFGTARGPGLVALLDASANAGARYDWVRAITPLAVSADVNLVAYNSVRALNPTGTAILMSGSGPIAYDNMATYGYAVPSGAAGVSLDAVGQTGTLSGGQVVLLTVQAGNASAAVVRTDRDDYAPGEAVTITGSGWQTGETVQLVVHVDPLTSQDRVYSATVDGSGNFTNTQFSPAIQDIGVRFVLTAVGQTSGLRAQTTFTDGNSTVTGVVRSSAVGTPVIAGATITCTSGCNANTPTATTAADGSYTLTVQFGGGNDGSFVLTASAAGFTSQNATVSVTNNGNRTQNFTLTPNVTTTTTGLTSSKNPSVSGELVTFTATVLGSPNPQCGTVDFKEGAATLGSVTLSGTNIAQFSTSGLSVATHSITAVYTPANTGCNFTGSTSSPALAQVVNRATTSTALISAPNPSSFGANVTFTATVSTNAPGAGTPTGTVTFKEGATTLGTGTLAAGQATFLTSGLTVGSHTITAEYGGDGQRLTSNSAGLKHDVNAAPSTTTLASAPNPSVFGQSVTLTATITSGAGTPNAGTVTFKDGATSLGTGAADATGKATLAVATLAVGAHSLTAEYGGAGNFAASTSQGLTHNVNKGSTATTLVSSVNPSKFGESVTFTATVIPVAPGAGAPTGTVAFRDGTTTIGSATLVAGVATLASNALPVGGHSITAEYAGDATSFNGSTSAALIQTVAKAATSTAVTSSSPTSVFGQSVTFTAKVTVPPPGSGALTGSVEFRDGATVLDTKPVDASGEAVYSTSTLAVASHSISAIYSGDGSFDTSTGTTTQNVVKAATTTGVVASPNPSVFGQAVTLTATVSVVSPGAGAPSGSVTFKDGGATLATVPLSSLQASYTTSGLSAGTHAITAEFSGNGDFETSTGAASQKVDKANTAAVVVSNSNPSVFGESVTFTATLTAVPLGAGTPTGVVTFKDGTTVLGTGTLDASGKCTFVTSTLAVASHPITANYVGDSNFNGSASAMLDQVVNKAITVTLASTSKATTEFGEPVTFTATVSVVAPGGGTPSGTVTFKEGLTILGTVSLSAGSATLSTASLTVGVHPIVAEYSGNGSFEGGSGSVSQTVVKAATATTVVTTKTPTVFGEPVKFTATVAVKGPGAGTPTGSITFKDGPTTLSTVPLTGLQAEYTTNSLAVGSRTITALYSGDNNFDVSNGSVIQAVDKANTSASVASSLNPALFGQSITFTATVTVVAPGAGIPTGPVTFKDAGTTLGTSALSASGTAAFTTSLSVASHSITAEYVGDGNFNGNASGSLSQVVNKAPTVLSDVTASQSIVYGTAQVSVGGKIASTTGPVPSGFVIVAVGAGAPVNATINPETGEFSTTYATTSFGVAGSPYTITYSYTENESFLGTSNGTTTLSVTPKPASVTPNPATKVFGEPDPPFSGTLTGFLPGDGVTATYSRAPGENVNGSPYAISATLLPVAVLSNYAINYSTASFVITKATPTITWTNPVDIIWPAALSSTQLNATANVSGSFTYIPASGAVLTPGVSQQLKANFTPADASNYNAATATVLINVLDKTAPIVSGSTANPNPIPLNTPTTITATVSDATTGGSAISSACFRVDGSLTCTAMTATSGTSFGQATVNVTGSLVGYATAGVHSVCVYGKDAAGNEGVEKVGPEQYCVLIAAFDPSAGFVTGGGWINSPVGAYAAGPSLTGKATFGFVSKYKKGQSTPDGDTEFQFHAAGFSFKSTSYEWLVIAGSKAQYKGSGTINGSGDYFFMLTAVDGDLKSKGTPDTFRMKVWNKTTLAVIYDNLIGAADTAEPTGPTATLGGGSIQIHDK